MTKSDTRPERVFVYGTLRRGGSNAFRMEGAEFVGAGEVSGELVAISWYPGLIPGRAGRWVTGDVFEVSPEHLRRLDENEGLAAGEVEGSEYRRIRMKVYAAGLQTSFGEAWVWQWIGPVDRNRIIRSGDWMDVDRPRPVALFTLVGVCCLLALPLGLAAGVVTGISDSLADRRLSALIIAGAAVFPLMALLAAYCGQKRRERWRTLRWIVASVSAILAALSLIILLRGVAYYWGRW